MLKRIISTTDSFQPTLLRLTLGLVMMPHAAQKLFRWFGGGGLSGTYSFMTEMVHLPPPVASLAIAAEITGAIGLVLGLFTRLAAINIFFVMLGAALTVHLPNGFFMNWYGNQKGEGFEYQLLAMGLAAAVIIAGGGSASIDRLLQASDGKK